MARAVGDGGAGRLRGRFCGLGRLGLEAQPKDQLVWIRMGEGVEDVPVLLSGCEDDGAEDGEAACAFPGAEAARYFLAQLGHPEIFPPRCW